MNRKLIGFIYAGTIALSIFSIDASAADAPSKVKAQLNPSNLTIKKRTFTCPDRLSLTGETTFGAIGATGQHSTQSYDLIRDPIETLKGEVVCSYRGSARRPMISQFNNSEQCRQVGNSIRCVSNGRLQDHFCSGSVRLTNRTSPQDFNVLTELGSIGPVNPRLNGAFVGCSISSEDWLVVYTMKPEVLEYLKNENMQNCKVKSQTQAECTAAIRI